jgi:hypothetical protein
MNLLQETIKDLKAAGKTSADVRFVSDGENWCTWENFAKAADFDYYRGFGSAYINGCLVIVGDNWWLERGEYDGSEWWEFKTLPSRPESSSNALLIEVWSML